MSKLDLTIACSDYDHVRDFASGKVIAQGIDARFVDLGVEEIFHRFLEFREWEVSEMSMAKFVSMRAANDTSVVGIPVFPSRVFRLSAVYVRSDSKLERFEDLGGKKIGVPEWAQTATIYTRGYLMHEAGVRLEAVKWFQGGVDQAGRKEKVKVALPQGVELKVVADKSLTQMLLDAEIDAIITANAPTLFHDGTGRIRRLVENFQPLEEAHFKKTGILPIMHLIVVRDDIAEKHPWVLMNLFKAFEEAKNRAVSRIVPITSTRVPALWLGLHVERTRKMFDGDYWPYGVEANRKTLEAFVAYAFEQGVCSRKMKPEELFPGNVMSSVRI